MLQSGSENNESRVSDMYEEFQKQDEKLSKYKHQIRMLKNKNAEFSDEVSTKLFL
jgi:hypothetical protein